MGITIILPMNQLMQKYGSYMLIAENFNYITGKSGERISYSLPYHIY